MVLPNFIIIGAQKSGTTSLYSYIKQHPQIYTSPIKEPQFFAVESEGVDFKEPFRQHSYIVTDFEKYHSLFQGVTDEIAIGEASTWYLHSPKAAQRIKEAIPDVKLIVILRDPVERAYSNFLHCRHLKFEPISDFEKALQEEKKRINQNWGHIWYYQQKGLYYSHLSKYFNLFDHNKIHVCLTEDLSQNSISTLQDLFHFLDVDSTYITDVSKRENISQKTVDKKRGILYCLKQIKYSKIPAKNEQQKVSPDLRKRLINQVYKEDIIKLQKLIDRDLSKWLN